MLRIPRAEVRRTATRKLSIVLLALLAVTGVLALLASPSPTSPPYLSTLYYYSGGAYHLIGSVHDAQGVPLSGVHVRFSSPQALPNGSTTSAVSDPEGIVRGAFPLPEGNYTFELSATNSAGTTVLGTEVTNWPVLPPQGAVVSGVNDIVPVPSGTYTSTGVLLVLTAGPNGTVPAGYTLQYIFEQFDQAARVPGTAPALDPVSANYSLGPIDSYTSVRPVPVAPAPDGLGPSILVEVVDPHHQVVSFAAFPPTDFGPMPNAPPAARAANLVLTEMALVATIAGLLGAVSLYGTERLSGTLEPYLARPVTAEGFLMARYVGLLLPLSAGVAIGWGAAGLGLSLRYGAPPPAALLAVGLLATLVGVSGWLGLAIALSHRLRTPLQLSTGVLALLVAFGFLWTPALTILGPAFGAPIGSDAWGHLLFDSSIINPALLAPTLVPLALLGTDGATLAGVLVVAALWTVIPILLGLERAARAD